MKVIFHTERKTLFGHLKLFKILFTCFFTLQITIYLINDLRNNSFIILIELIGLISVYLVNEYILHYE